MTDPGAGFRVPVQGAQFDDPLSRTVLRTNKGPLDSECGNRVLRTQHPAPSTRNVGTEHPARCTLHPAPGTWRCR